MEEPHSPSRPTPGDAHPPMVALLEPLICEGCGYPLDGLDVVVAVCPECGKPARDSLPTARAGTPWQVSPSPIAYFRTVGLMLTRPRKVWAVVRLGRHRAASLLILSLVLPGLVGSIAMLAGFARAPYIAIFSISLTATLTVLTFTEMGGLYVFGRRRGFRMKGNVPLVICAHAASGWWVSVLGMVIVIRATEWMKRVHFPLSGWLEGRTAIVWYFDVQNTGLLIGGVFIAGMVVYSLLAGAGFHALRHVNRPGGET